MATGAERRLVITQDRRGLLLAEAQAHCAACPVRPDDAPAWQTVEFAGGIRTVSGAKRAARGDAARCAAYCAAWRRLGECGLVEVPTLERPRFWFRGGVA